MTTTIAQNPAPSTLAPDVSLKAPKRISAKRLRLENLVLQVLVIAAIFGLWEYASDRWVPSLFISKPSKIGETMWAWTKDGTFVTHIWVTLQATVMGFLAGAIGGMISGYITGVWRRLGDGNSAC